MDKKPQDIKKNLKLILYISTLLFLSGCFLEKQYKINYKPPKYCGIQHSSLIFNLKTGAVISEFDADNIIYPASLTKLMTFYLALEEIKDKKLKLSDKLIASAKAVEISKINKFTTLNLKLGDELTVNDAIKGLIIKSFNELAIMLAEKISTSEWQFARDMNIKAKELGMYFTNFRNSTGLHDNGQFTTVRDLKKLVLAIKKDFPEYYYIFGLKNFFYKNVEYISHNNILHEYENSNGIKTGFTSISGFNLISSVKKNNQSIVSILTECESSENRDYHSKRLLDFAFSI